MNILQSRRYTGSKVFIMRNYIFPIACFCAVSACGSSSGDSVTSSVDSGGGETAPQSFQVDTTPIKVFADGSGVARYTGTSDGEAGVGYIISPELIAVLNELEATGEVLLDDSVDNPLLSQVASRPNTIISRGVLSVDGLAINVLAASTIDEDAILLLAEDPLSGFSILQTAGEQVSSLPSGTINYAGTLGLQNILSGAEPEIGSFTAVADFDGTPGIFLVGKTDSYGLSGRALISGGSFVSTSMTISDGAFSTAASMNGDFHGDGANSVAGVIYSNDSLANFRGGFVGSQ